MVHIEARDITLTYQTPNGAVPAVHGVSFGIETSEFLCIVGPSGCGKSTLLNIAAGLLAPSSGTVRVDGEPLVGLCRRATYMFQQDALLPWKTVRENVALGLTIGGVARAAANARADAWLARVGLAPFAAHYPSQLSGGMRKRVTMAQNWIIDRGLLLMDEPFSALDVHTRQRMETELLSLWDESGSSRTLREHATPASPGSGSSRTPSGHAVSVVSGLSQTPRKTVIFVTHDLEEAIALADEVVVLSAGPATRVVARHPVTLARPRDLLELRTAQEFIDLYRAIWAVLRGEVIKSQQAMERSRG
jgi:NitT/TauT family transport system ATP-binding protein